MQASEGREADKPCGPDMLLLPEYTCVRDLFVNATESIVLSRLAVHE